MGKFEPSLDPYRCEPTGRARYQVLHDAAEVLLDELAGQYVVDRRETKEPAGPGPYAEHVRTVRLIPRHPAAAPLSIAFTDFPGVVLRLGRWFVETFPHGEQGDEDPSELIAGLRARMDAHVEGGLWERVRRGLTGSVRETRLIGRGLRISRQAPVDNREARAARRDGFAAAVQWAPWSRRAPQDAGRP
ncbi:DUF6226 family protein [Couchioplanes azureus]|uniref:DUF6226 family protein n=1 Tax=Couchioplanes caeruleus TaxID=56438 RepID=UPI0016713100|nr:DUF6226 family protein [Couchioplanes caeruleus]GGQ69776.1 hypothetical protein GCM10010166_44500 [Couchioplanes caeruleus subsp. azureus]